MIRAMAEVVLRDPEATNLLALFLRSLLRRGLSDAAAAARASGTTGALVVASGAMAATVTFGEPIEIARGAADKPRARVDADLKTLLAVARGASPFGLLLRGELSFSGSPLFLLKILPILQSAKGGA
jgi:hypothetical protein